MKGLANSKPVKRLAASTLPACWRCWHAPGWQPPRFMALRKRRHTRRARLLQKVGINQKMGAQIPLDLPFVDESGKDVTLRQYFGKPVILALVYYQCPSLCNMVLNGVLRSIKSVDLTAGKRV